jgi:glycosyltransferase involved in cell wall biosynthesis
VAILEAMAQSLPVISTRHGKVPEAVLDGSTGYLMDEGASMAMAEWLVAVARNHDQGGQMGIAHWQRAREHFTREREWTASAESWDWTLKRRLLAAESSC